MYLVEDFHVRNESEEKKIIHKAESINNKGEKTLRLFLKRAKGSLRVKSLPPNAAVYLGNEYLGKTPFYKRNVKRSEGGVQLKFRKDGCDSKTVILNWGDDLESKVSVSLKCKK